MTTPAQQQQQWQQYQQFLQWQQMQQSQQQQPPWQQNHENTVVHKENVHLTTSTVRAGIIGMAQAQLRARLTDLDGEGIAGETVSFVVTSTREEFGSSTTDDQGVAQLDTGANIADPQIWISAGTSGYTAIYNGSKRYKSQEARGKFQIAL